MSSTETQLRELIKTLLATFQGIANLTDEDSVIETCEYAIEQAEERLAVIDSDAEVKKAAIGQIVNQQITEINEQRLKQIESLFGAMKKDREHLKGEIIDAVSKRIISPSPQSNTQKDTPRTAAHLKEEFTNSWQGPPEPLSVSQLINQEQEMIRKIAEENNVTFDQAANHFYLGSPLPSREDDQQP